MGHAPFLDAGSWGTPSKTSWSSPKIQGNASSESTDDANQHSHYKSTPFSELAIEEIDK